MNIYNKTFEIVNLFRYGQVGQAFPRNGVSGNDLTAIAPGPAGIGVVADKCSVLESCVLYRTFEWSGLEASKECLPYRVYKTPFRRLYKCFVFSWYLQLSAYTFHNPFCPPALHTPTDRISEGGVGWPNHIRRRGGSFLYGRRYER